MPSILLIDDDKDFSGLAAAHFSRQGHSVTLAEGGREGLDKAASARPDIVLLDIMMPDMNGVEVLHELRRVYPDVRVILSSGYSEAELRSRYAGDGFAGFLQKPYRMQTLQALLEQTLGKGDRVDPCP